MFAQIPAPPVAVTDWPAIIRSIADGAIAILVAWTAFKAKQTAAQVAAIVPVVQATSAKLNDTADTVKIIHTLSNGTMTAQKKLTADLSEAKAVLQPTPENIQAAGVARADYADHMARQAVVDSGVKT